MARILFIIAQDGFRDEELFEPKEILEKAGHNCEIASIEKKTCSGMMGAKVNPDLIVAEAGPEDYDCIIVVGGRGAPKLAEYPDVLELLKNAYKAGKLIAAICLGPIVLAKAGLLNSVEAVVFPDKVAIDILKNGKAKYVAGKDIANNKKIITATGPRVAKLFVKEIANTLKV